jgi:hypothetical protein
MAELHILREKTGTVSYSNYIAAGAPTRSLRIALRWWDDEGLRACKLMLRLTRVARTYV